MEDLGDIRIKSREVEVGGGRTISVPRGAIPQVETILKQVYRFQHLPNHEAPPIGWEKNHHRVGNMAMSLISKIIVDDLTDGQQQAEVAALVAKVIKEEGESIRPLLVECGFIQPQLPS